MNEFPIDDGWLQGEMMLTGGKWGEASCAHCNRSLGAAITCPHCGFINAHVDSDDKSTNLCQNSFAKRQMQPADCAAAIRARSEK